MLELFLLARGMGSSPSPRTPEDQALFTLLSIFPPPPRMFKAFALHLTAALFALL